VRLPSDPIPKYDKIVTIIFLVITILTVSGFLINILNVSIAFNIDLKVPALEISADNPDNWRQTYVNILGRYRVRIWGGQRLFSGIVYIHGYPITLQEQAFLHHFTDRGSTIVGRNVVFQDSHLKPYFLRQGRLTYANKNDYTLRTGGQRVYSLINFGAIHTNSRFRDFMIEIHPEFSYFANGSRVVLKISRN